MLQKDRFYNQFTQSNEGLIPKELQQIFKETPIAILGAGMGSNIATLLIQSGFENITALTDPDYPEASNLNRQRFILNDVSNHIPKVDALKKHLLDINPYAKITTYPSGTTPENTSEIVSQATIIIDAMDPFDALEPAVEINKQARQQNKVVLFPIELAYIAGVYVFSPNTPSLEKFYNLENYQSGPPDENQKTNIVSTLLQEADDFGKQIAVDYLTGKLTKYPQSPLTTAAASLLTTLITEKIIADQNNINFLPNFKINYAPTINKYNLINPTG
jgi:molybdopterin/thiamine biosynthesis adenylyltransferase